MPKTQKSIPLSREMEQRERETTMQSLIIDKSKSKRAAASTGGKRSSEKQSGGQKGQH